MGRPKGSKTKSAMSAEKPVLTDEQQQALFFDHLKRYEAALETKKAADAAFKNVCKLAKAEGTALVDIKTAIALGEESGSTDLKSRIEASLRVARWMGAAVGTQFDMFGVAPMVDIAYDDGKRDGLAGRESSPKYSAGTAQYDRYFEGWQAGQAILLSAIKPIDDARPAAETVLAEEFDDATSSRPSRRQKAKHPLEGADAAGSYQHAN